VRPAFAARSRSPAPRGRYSDQVQVSDCRRGWPPPPRSRWPDHRPAGSRREVASQPPSRKPSLTTNARSPIPIRHRRQAAGTKARGAACQLWTRSPCLVKQAGGAQCARNRGGSWGKHPGGAQPVRANPAAAQARHSPGKAAARSHCQPPGRKPSPTTNARSPIPIRHRRQAAGTKARGAACPAMDPEPLLGEAGGGRTVRTESRRDLGETSRRSAAGSSQPRQPLKPGTRPARPPRGATASRPAENPHPLLTRGPRCPSATGARPRALKPGEQHHHRGADC